VVGINSSSWTDEVEASDEDNVSRSPCPEDEDEEQCLPTQVLCSRIEAEEDNGPGSTGWVTSALLIVNAALGAGLLNFPQAFDQAGGVVVATSVQLVSSKCNRMHS